MTAIGYGLFLAVNAVAVWGAAVSPEPDALFWFTLAEATAFALTFLARVIGAYRAPARIRRLLPVSACLPYLAGWACMIAGGFAVSIAGGALIGVGAAGFYLLWGRLFAGRQPEEGTRDLLVGTACAPVFYLALAAIPAEARVVAAPVAALAAGVAAVALSGRGLDLEQPMFAEPPAEHARVYRRAVADTWRSALCLGGLGTASGIMRAVAVTDPSIGPAVNAFSMAALFLASAGLLFIWKRHGVEVNVVNAYRCTFPVVITAFLVIPAAPNSWIAPIAGLLYALYGIAVMALMAQCAQISRDRGINPLFAMGFFGGIVFVLHDAGLVLGRIASGIVVAGLSTQAMLALAAVYLLSLLFVAGQRREGARPAAFSDGNSIELVAGAKPAGHAPGEATDDAGQPEAAGAATPPDTATGALSGDSAPVADSLAVNIERIRRDFGLTKREAEVADLLARGDTVARIAERLFVSENTVRTHSKHIYQKLGINKKQQLRDLAIDYPPAA